MSEEIKFKITLDGKEFIATADLSDKALDKIADKLGNVKTKGQDSFSSLASNWSNVVTGLNQGIQLLNQIVDVISAPIKTAAMFEGFETQLKVMLGSMDAAKVRMKELADFAATTPFTLPEVVSASNRLQALGRYSIETIRTLGDLAAASGKPFDQVMNAYSSLVSGQKGEAIRMFRDLLITSKDWAKATGAVIKNGEVMTSTDELARALPKIMKERGFDGMMAQQAQTMNGIVSNFEDAMTRMSAAVGNILLPRAKEDLRNLTGIIGNLAILIERASSTADEGTKSLLVKHGNATPIWDIWTVLRNATDTAVRATAPDDSPINYFDAQISKWQASVEKRKKLLEELNDPTTASPKRSKGVNKTADDMIEAERKRLEGLQQNWVGHLEEEARAEEKALSESRERNEEWAADIQRIRREKEDEERLSWARNMQEDPATIARDNFIRDTVSSFRYVRDGLADAMAQAMVRGKVRWGQLLRDMAQMVAVSTIKSAILNLFNLAIGGGPIGRITGGGVQLAAKGAVIDKPTMLIAGEAGREYYIPESNMKALINELLSGGLARAAAGPNISSGINNLVRSGRSSLPTSSTNNNDLVAEIRSLHATLIHKDMTTLLTGDLQTAVVVKRIDTLNHLLQQYSF